MGSQITICLSVLACLLEIHEPRKQEFLLLKDRLQSDVEGLVLSHELVPLFEQDLVMIFQLLPVFPQVSHHLLQRTQLALTHIDQLPLFLAHLQPPKLIMKANSYCNLILN